MNQIHPILPSFEKQNGSFTKEAVSLSAFNVHASFLLPASSSLIFHVHYKTKTNLESRERQSKPRLSGFLESLKQTGKCVEEKRRQKPFGDTFPMTSSLFFVVKIVDFFKFLYSFALVVVIFILFRFPVEFQ